MERESEVHTSALFPLISFSVWCRLSSSCLSVHLSSSFLVTGMDLRTVVAISTLLVMTAESDPTSSGTPSTPSSPTNSTNRTSSLPSTGPTTPAGAPSFPSSSAPALGLLTIQWRTKCEGEVNLVLYHPSNASSPVCHGSEMSVQSVLRKVCENKDGCENRPPSWKKGQDAMTGYDITERGARSVWCKTLKVQCTVQVHPDVDLQGQLQAYRVVTALLCCVLLVLILIRFTRPSITALQKRLSERRQNRWIGPTQSHSVSYHRGKSAVKSNDGEMRLSYPALERLTVSDSREPSSNRNSDYNF